MERYKEKMNQVRQILIELENKEKKKEKNCFT